MTPNDKKKILDWIEENERRVLDSVNRYVSSTALTAFIESLSTEEVVEQQRDNLLEHVKQMLPYIKEYDKDNYTDEGVGIFQDKKLTWLADYTPIFISNIENGLTQ